MKIIGTRAILGAYLAFYLLSYSHDSLANNRLGVMPPDWYKVGIFVNFDNVKIRSSYLNLYKSVDDTVASTLDNALSPLPFELKQKLFASETRNPFQILFPQVYLAEKNNLYQHCDFVGIQFELDDNQKTKEWFISFPAEKCINKGDAIMRPSEAESHAWIMQKKGDGIYTILMQSEGSLYVLNDKKQGYKTLETKIFNQAVKRDNQQSCGYGIISWRYQNKRYTPQRLFPKINGCEHLFPEIGASPEQREQTVFNFVEKNLLNRLNQLMQYTLFRSTDGDLQINPIQSIKN